MTSRRRTHDGELSPEMFISKMATSDYVKVMGGLLVSCLVIGGGTILWVERREKALLDESKGHVTEAVQEAVTPIMVKLENLGQRMDRIEGHEDSWWGDARGSVSR